LFDGLVHKFMCLVCKWISFMPCIHRAPIARPVIAAFVTPTIFFGIALSWPLLTYGPATLLAARVTPQWAASIFGEFIQWPSFAALSANFAFHKNAPCQLGVSACV
jgi:hypothetical protein